MKPTVDKAGVVKNVLLKQLNELEINWKENPSWKEADRESSIKQLEEKCMFLRAAEWTFKAIGCILAIVMAIGLFLRELIGWPDIDKGVFLFFYGLFVWTMHWIYCARHRKFKQALSLVRLLAVLEA